MILMVFLNNLKTGYIRTLKLFFQHQIYSQIFFYAKERAEMSQTVGRCYKKLEMLNIFFSNQAKIYIFEKPLKNKCKTLIIFEPFSDVLIEPAP